MDIEELQKKYHDLRSRHHEVLHELADAAQIIKSYEYLEKRQEQETMLLKRIARSAHELCHVVDFSSFKEQRKKLVRVIYEYKSNKWG